MKHSHALEAADIKTVGCAVGVSGVGPSDAQVARADIAALGL